MSIDLIGVSHSIKPRRSRRRIEFRDVNMHIEEGQRVGILGKKGGGLEELLNLICGAVYPARGNIIRTSEMSWPIGSPAVLSLDASLAANLKFLARVYETDAEQYARRVDELADIQDQWHEKLGGCSRDLRARFAFALGVCLPFDIYLFESAEVADRSYRDRVEAVVTELGQEFGTVVTTSKGEIAQQFCDRAFVLDGGTITYYEDIDEAVAHLERLEEPAAVDLGEDFVEEDRDEDLDII